MNDRPGTSPKSLPFATSAVDYASLPGQSRIFLDHTARSEAVLSFYPTLNADLRQHSETVLGSYDGDRSELCGLLRAQNEAWGAEGAVFTNIERLGSDSCVTVMTGQQAGLFTGPAYTIYKAVSAIQLADRLTADGIDAVPVFWIASEDHDIDEVSMSGVVGADGAFAKIMYTADDADAGKPVGNVSFDEGIRGVLNELQRVLPESSEKPGVLEMVRDCYQPGVSFSDAFAKMMIRLFAGRGLVLVSPMDARFRAAALPIVERAVEEAAGIRDAVTARDSQLEEAGYHSQVRVAGDFFPFFLIGEDGKREPLRFGEGGERIVTSDGSASFTKESLIDLLRKDPAVLSPSALMRPVVQDYVFPNVCYFGGAAEIAYFGQNSAIFELLGRPVTPIRHRAAFTIIEPRNRRAMESYGLDLSDLFEGRESVSERIAAKALHPETAARFDKTIDEIESLLDSLGDELEASDRTLSDSLERRKPKMLWHVSRLKEKFLRSEALKDEVVNRRLGYIFSTLLPDDGLQERSLSFVHFLDLYGTESVEWLFEAAPVGRTEHTIITL